MHQQPLLVKVQIWDKSLRPDAALRQGGAERRRAAQILRTAVWIPVAPAHRSLHAVGLWSVINYYPMASIKAKERAQWDALALGEGVQKEGMAISSWAFGDRKCFGMP